MIDWNVHMPTSLRGIANRAQRDPDAVFGDLYRLLNESNLKLCFGELRKSAAPGVDRVTVEAYASDLDANLISLVERLKRKSYRAKLVRRKHIPKGDGKSRSLGIPALEDKLLQRACASILGAIWEGDFLDFSWGYRKGRSAREASLKLRNALQKSRCNWVVEADIKGFFDNLDHNWMERMLRHRINDGAFIRLIRKWMRAGILEEDGKVLHPESGTPQGGIISPVLANIYLHYALDLWVEKRVKKMSRGQVGIIRYADDFVCAFEHEDEARRFLHGLKERLAKFGLELAPEKTRLVRFSRYGGKGNGNFEFLGFAYHWEKSRKGYPMICRRTAAKRLNRSLGKLKDWLKESRHQRLRPLMGALNAKLRGYRNYYGVRGNYRDLNKFFYLMRGLLFKWLNRRSQRGSFGWDGFERMCLYYNLVQPKLIETIEQPRLFH